LSIKLISIHMRTFSNKQKTNKIETEIDLPTYSRQQFEIKQ